MSFLNNLLGHMEPSVESTGEKGEKPDITSELSPGITLTVVRPGNDAVTFRGEIGSVGEDALTLICPPDVMEFPRLNTGEVVQVNGYAKTLKSVSYRANIADSRARRCKITGLTAIKHENMRKSVRIPSNASCRMENVEKMSIEDFVSTMRNISTGGACVSTSEEFFVDDAVTIRVRLTDDQPELTLTGKICRVSQKGNAEYECGIQFNSMDDTQQAELNSALYRLQAQLRKEH